MSRILTVAIFALALAGCTNTNSYDEAAMSDARAAMRHAFDGCRARLAAHDIKSNSDWASCSLAAERGYFTAIKMKNMVSFDAYAADYLTLAADLDANRVSRVLARRRASDMQKQFYVACDCGGRGASGSWNPFVSSPTSDAGPGMPPSPPSLSLP